MKIKFSLTKLLIGYFIFLTLLMTFGDGEITIKGPILVVVVTFYAYVIGFIPALATGFVSGKAYQKTTPIKAMIITIITGGLSVSIPLSIAERHSSFYLYILSFSLFHGLLSAFLTNIIVQQTIKNSSFKNLDLTKSPVLSASLLFLFIGPLVGLAIIVILMIAMEVSSLW